MADFVFFNENKDNLKKINWPMSLFVNYVRASARRSLEYFIWLKS